MKIDTYQPNNSAFLSINKDMKIIVDEIFKNQTLQKLLYYTTKDAYERPKLTPEQSLDLYGKNILTVPKMYVDNDVKNYIFIAFDNFVENNTNPQFKDHLIEIDIACHYDQWQLTGFDLRPYRIAAEIDWCLNNKRLSGIGELKFLGCTETVYNSEFGGLCMLYTVTHSTEDTQDQNKIIDAEKYFQH